MIFAMDKRKLKRSSMKFNSMNKNKMTYYW